jgi:hypothetical protein
MEGGFPSPSILGLISELDILALLLNNMQKDSKNQK